eukprot:SAG31_NODE_31647_length_365_cov_7.266917_1_plen_40_part_01
MIGIGPRLTSLSALLAVRVACAILQSSAPVQKTCDQFAQK